MTGLWVLAVLVGDGVAWLPCSSMRGLSPGTIRIRIVPRRWGCGSWRCLQMVVWLGLATRSNKSAPVWRTPEGLEGTGGLRDAAQSEVRSPSLAGGRALRRPEHQRAMSVWRACDERVDRDRAAWKAGSEKSVRQSGQ